MTYFPKADAASVEEHDREGEGDESFPDENNETHNGVDSQSDSDAESSTADGEAAPKKKKPKLGFRDRKVRD